MDQITRNDVDKLNHNHHLIEQLGTEIISLIIESGELLTGIKKSVGHGKWMGWVKANLKFTDRTASRYMLVAEYKKDVNRTCVSNLTSALSLVENIKEFDSMSRNWDISANRKSEIRKSITAETSFVDIHAKAQLSDAERSQIKLPSPEEIQDLQYKRTIQANLKKARLDIQHAAYAIRNVHKSLKAAGIKPTRADNILEDFEYWLPAGLHESIKKLNQVYGDLYRAYGCPEDEEPPARKQVESKETVTV